MKFEHVLKNSMLYLYVPSKIKANAHFDVPAGCSTWDFNPGAPSQVKLMKGGAKPLAGWPGLRDTSVTLAKAEGVYDPSALELCVGVWSRDNDNDPMRVDCVHRLFFEEGFFAKIMGGLPLAELLALDEMVKERPGLDPKSAEFDALTEEFHKLARELEAKHGMVARLAVKIDHHRQRRVQSTVMLADLLPFALKHEVLLPEDFDDFDVPKILCFKPRKRKARQEEKLSASVPAKVVNAGKPAKAGPVHKPSDPEKPAEGALAILEGAAAEAEASLSLRRQSLLREALRRAAWALSKDGLGAVGLNARVAGLAGMDLKRFGELLFGSSPVIGARLARKLEAALGLGKYELERQ